MSTDKSQLADSVARPASDTSFRPEDLNQYVAYYWHVRPVDAAGSPGRWSSTQVLVVYDSNSEMGADDIFAMADGTELNKIISRDDGYVFLPGGTFDIKIREGSTPYTDVTVTSFSMKPSEVTHKEFLVF